MQPTHENDQWQQPTEQPGAAPFVAPVSDTAPASSPETPQTGLVEPQPAISGPVITLTPSEPLVDSTQPAQETPSTSLPGGEVEDAPIVRWQASEYIHREKDVLWYVIFAVVTVALMSLALFFIHSLTFVILIPVMAVALFMYSRRPPRLLTYTLSRQGLHVHDHLYSFTEFKSFTVIHGDDEYSIMLVPTKRFHLGLSVYFPEESGEAIVDAMAARLPMNEAQIDPIDRVIRKLRI